MLKEEAVRYPDGLELAGQVAERPLVRLGELSVTVLVETGQRRRIGTSEAKRAVTENSLGIDQMTNDLLDRPCVGRVTD